MAKTRIDDVKKYGDVGDFSHADRIHGLQTQINRDRGFTSERKTHQALATLLDNGEIRAFRDMTGTRADFFEVTDFIVTLCNGVEKRIQVKSSANTIRLSGNDPKYQDIAFLVIKSDDSDQMILDKIRRYILGVRLVDRTLR